MKFYFFKRNYTRQMLLYLTLILCVFITWQALRECNYISAAVFGTTAFLLLAWILYQYFSYIQIDDKGIAYHSLLKKYCLRWADIGQVKVIPRWNVQIPWLVILRSGDPEELKRKRNAMNRRDECITFPFIKEAAELINRLKSQYVVSDPVTFEPKIEALQSEEAAESAVGNKPVPATIQATVIKRRYTVLHAAISVACLVPMALLFSDVFRHHKLPQLLNVIFIGFIIFMLGALLQFIWMIFYGQYSYSVQITPVGVVYRKRKKTYSMAWEDVDRVLVMPNRYGIYNQSATVCFLRKGADKSVITVEMNKFGPDFFGVQYRKRVVAVVQKYWGGYIHNIQNVCGKT